MTTSTTGNIPVTINAPDKNRLLMQGIRRGLIIILAAIDKWLTD